LADIQVRFRTPFAYVDGCLPNGEVLPLCRLRYAGSATFWGFAVYLASGDRYEDSVLPNGAFEATPQDALAGTGTTLQVARQHGRHAIGIELNADYIELIKARLLHQTQRGADARKEAA
jgi:hypothetical protein